MNIFVFTASNKEAQKHLQDSILKSVDENIVKEYLSNDIIADIKSKKKFEGFYCWGAVPGKSNERNWGQLKENDYVLTYYDQKIHLYAKVIHKIRNYELAKRIWGKLPDGKTWEYMYFLTKPIRLNKIIKTIDVSEYLQSQFQGFSKIKDSKVNKIINDFSSIEKFLLNPIKDHIQTNVWFVCQGDTYNDNQGKKYLWAPQKDKNGNGNHFWDKMQQVKKGDYIFHYANGLRGISMADSDCFQAENPVEDLQWKKEGYQVYITQLFEFTESLHYTKLQDHQSEFDKILKELKGPFDINGNIKQGYLFDFNQDAGKLIRSIYGEEFPEPYESFFALEEVIKPIDIMTTAISPKHIVKHIHQYILGQGFYFKYEDIANFYLCLKTKPFVILAGISGTGKSQLIQKFAEAISCEQSCSLIPVKPDWTDNSDLIGYLDLQHNFHAKKALMIIKEAHENPNQPYFLILDEMNLARVEYYFSDFLSIIETRKRKEGEIVTDFILKANELDTAEDKAQFGNIRIPENLYVVGTVNMDETTHPFSRKVLDRANSIEINNIELGWADEAESKYPIRNIYNDFVKTTYVGSKELSKEEKASISDEIELLKSINEILEKADLHFAYRVRDEIAFYLLINQRYDLISNEKAIDYQIMQKVLPRIQGSSSRIEQIIKDLLVKLNPKLKIDNSNTYDEVKTAIVKLENKAYDKSTNKLLFMLRRYDDDGFTSFWQ